MSYKLDPRGKILLMVATTAQKKDATEQTPAEGSSDGPVVVAQGKAPAAHKGMVHAAKIMAAGGLDSE